MASSLALATSCGILDRMSNNLSITAMQEDEATLSPRLALLFGIVPPPPRPKSVVVRRYSCPDDSADPPAVRSAEVARAAVRSSPRREAIYEMVKKGVFTVQEIADAMKISTTTTHQHLRVLLEAGAVKRRKISTEKGVWILVYFTPK